MMRMSSVALAGLALACSSVDSRPSCASSTDCPVGEYCASTPDGNVCWADPVAPVVSAVSVTCDASPCRRDGVLHVTATVTDDREVLDASVSVDLGPASPVAMVRSGGSWAADVPLGPLAFDAFSRDVVATVTARDGARNAGTPVPGAPVHVTRLLWERVIDATVGFRPTVPAVMPDGTAVLGGSTGKLYFIAPDGTDAHPPLAVGTGQISAAPSIGEHAIWVGSEDYSVYAVSLDTKVVLPNLGVNTDGVVIGSLAILPSVGKEWAIACSSSGRLGAASSSPSEYARSGAGDGCTVGPIIGLTAAIYSVTVGVVSTATLRRFAFDGAFTPVWTASTGARVIAPVSASDDGGIWSGSEDGALMRTVPGETSGTVQPIASVGGSIVDSPVILSNGDVVVGDQSGVLHRYLTDGTPAWTAAPNLGAAVLAPLVLTGTSNVLVVPTKGGRLYAIDAATASDAWSTTLDPTELRAGNIYTPPGQSGTPISIAYFSATNGKLYAVLVDGELDASAPWPKAFHDPRNTNRAGPQP